MAGFDDLVARVSRSGRLCDNIAAVTEGASFSQRYYLLDTSGAPVSLTGATVEAKVLDGIDGATVVTLTGAGTSDGLTLSATAATMAGKVGSGQTERRCTWYCKVTLSGQTIYAWRPVGSQFIIGADGVAA